MKNILLIILFTTTSFAQVTQEWVSTFSGSDVQWGQFVNSIAVDGFGNAYVIAVRDSGINNDKDYTILKYNSAGIEQWDEHYDGTGNGEDIPHSIAVDELGNVFVTGHSKGTETLLDYATIKYDTDGVLQWVKLYNGTGNANDMAKSITVDEFGNVYVTGESDGVGTSIDYVTIKYSTNGTEEWVKRFNGTANGNDLGYRIAVDISGNVYATGSSSSGSGQDYNFATVKYNSSGDQQWVKVFDGPASGEDNPFAISVDDAGNVYLAGESEGVGTYTDFTTIKYNTNGDFQWEHFYNGSGNSSDVATSIALDNEGNVFVTGYTWEISNNADYTTIKYNTDGDPQWIRTYSRTIDSDDLAKSIAVDETGNVYVTGESWDSGTEYDYATIKYNSTGAEQWVQTYGTENLWDYAKSIAIDDEGNVYVAGYTAINENDYNYTTIKYSQGLKITEPQAEEKWIAGKTDTIKWTGGQQGQLLDLEYTTDNGNSFTVIQLGVLAESLSYAWTIPNNLISTKVKIRLTDVVNTFISVTSDSFRVKPYIITKVDANGDYISYDRVIDVWNFGNYTVDMWPMAWYSQFDYQGIDPFTSSQYSQWQADFTFATSLNSEHPDWITWVNVFGLDACYYSTTLSIYNPSAVLRWEAIKGTWNGSCFGIAASNALAFSFKDEFLEAYLSFPSFFSPITVVSDTGVKRVVNELFAHQIGNPSQQATLNNNRWKTITPNETLNEVKAMLIEDSVKIRTLSLRNNNGVGGHNILLYGLEQDETQKELYYLFVYDNSHPSNTTALILIDTTGNSNQGTWLTTYAWTTWGGPTKLMLEIESSNYLTDPILPNKTREIESPFILSENQLDIHSNLDANVQIVDMQGNITGFINDVLYDEIPEASPLIYLNGSETPPYGYSLPTDNYSVILNEFAEDTVETFFFNGNKSFVYERSGAEQTQIDRLFFDGGISVANPDAQTKTINLLNLINETTQEKLAVVRSIELAQNDSVKIENPDSNKVKLISYGTTKNYDIELNYVTENGIGRFGDFDVPLEANTSHTFGPNWTDITNTDLEVLVDIGNDGTIDDTLSLINQLTGLGNDQGSLIPTEFRLEQNYPNPFNPVTTIQYSLPQRSNVTLKVYDELGKEIAVLVIDEKDRGVYNVNFDATGLASGIYFYRLQTGSFVETKKMILLR